MQFKSIISFFVLLAGSIFVTLQLSNPAEMNFESDNMIFFSSTTLPKDFTPYNPKAGNHNSNDNAISSFDFNNTGFQPPLPDPGGMLDGFDVENDNIVMIPVPEGFKIMIFFVTLYLLWKLIHFKLVAAKIFKTHN